MTSTIDPPRSTRDPKHQAARHGTGGRTQVLAGATLGLTLLAGGALGIAQVSDDRPTASDTCCSRRILLPRPPAAGTATAGLVGRVGGGLAGRDHRPAPGPRGRRTRRLGGLGHARHRPRPAGTRRRRPVALQRRTRGTRRVAPDRRRGQLPRLHRPRCARSGSPRLRRPPRGTHSTASPSTPRAPPCTACSATPRSNSAATTRASRACSAWSTCRPTPRRWRGSSYTHELNGDVDEARAVMERALEAAANPSDEAFALFQLGELSLGQGDPAAALGLFNRALAASPDNVSALSGKAHALGRVRPDADVDRRRTDSSSSAAPLPDYLIEFGNFLEAHGRPDEAARALRRGPFAARRRRPQRRARRCRHHLLRGRPR